MAAADGSRYDDDFYAWTQEQAELLRRLPTVSNHLDRELIAEEIEDLGRSELHAGQSLCEHIIEHLLKLEYSGINEPSDHWRREIVEWRIQLGRKFDPRHHRQARPRRPLSLGAAPVAHL